jgi:single-stranded DNA-binding protein
MIGANHVLLIGEVTDIRTHPKVLNLRIKVTESYVTRDGEVKQRSGSHKVTIFGEQKVKYLESAVAVGSLVQAVGRLENSSYDDKNGVKQWETKVVAQEVTLLSHADVKPVASADDIPF